MTTAKKSSSHGKTWRDEQAEGDTIFHITGFKKAVNLNSMEVSIAVVLNIALLVIISFGLH